MRVMVQPLRNKDMWVFAAATERVVDREVSMDGDLWVAVWLYTHEDHVTVDRFYDRANCDTTFEWNVVSLVHGGWEMFGEPFILLPPKPRDWLRDTVELWAREEILPYLESYYRRTAVV